MQIFASKAKQMHCSQCLHNVCTYTIARLSPRVGHEQNARGLVVSLLRCHVQWRELGLCVFASVCACKANIIKWRADCAEDKQVYSWLVCHVVVVVRQIACSRIERQDGDDAKGGQTSDGRAHAHHS